MLNFGTKICVLYMGGYGRCFTSGFSSRLAIAVALLVHRNTTRRTSRYLSQFVTPQRNKAVNSVFERSEPKQMQAEQTCVHVYGEIPFQCAGNLLTWIKIAQQKNRSLEITIQFQNRVTKSKQKNLKSTTHNWGLVKAIEAFDM